MIILPENDWISQTSNVSISIFFKNSLPTPLLKYFSRSLAAVLVSTSSVYININGLYGFVVLFFEDDAEGYLNGISSFGEDADGELYIATIKGGSAGVYRIDPQ